MKVFILAEHKAGQLKKATKEILGLCQGHEVEALIVGSQAEPAAQELAASGVSRVHWCQDTAFDSYHPLAYADLLTQVLDQSQAKCVLGTASALGKDLLARVAARKDANLVADAIALAWGDRPKLRRPFFAGKAQADVELAEDAMYFVSLRANSFPEGKVSDQKGEVVSCAVAYDFGSSPIEFIEKTAAKSDRPDLTEAAVIVSGGRSLKTKENFQIIFDCADALGGAPGASRAACDEGLADHSMQVGQTGKTVNPSLYIACGISGAIQHLAGMRTSKVIVAINSDPQAPIFSKADYGIVDDLFQVVPALTEKAKILLSR